MKTNYEYQYERVILNQILRTQNSFEEKLSCLIEFHQNSKSYYEMLCDYLYMISVGRTDHSLWITLSGKPLLSDAVNIPNSYLVCNADHLPAFKEDIIAQLMFALQRIESLFQMKEVS